MKKIFLILLFFISCSPLKQLPVKEITVVRDSVSVRDSVVYTPEIRYVDVVSELDTLKMKDNFSEATAWLDTNLRVLRGELISKPQIVYKCKLETQIRDSIQVKEIPYPVEVEKKVTPEWAWYSLIVNLILLFVISAVVFFKIKF